MPLAQSYVLRKGSGSIGPSEDQIVSIRPLGWIRPISAVLAMWWFSPLTVTLPSGASKLTPPAAA